MTQLTLTVENDDAPTDDVRAVVDGLTAFNRTHVPDPGSSTLRIFLRDETGAVYGGLLGDIYFGWLFVAILWVDGQHRGGGHGSRLLREAEAQAAARGCHAVWLDTFSFQAPEFYRRHGYHEFARLDGYPEGFSRHYFRKDLAPPA